MAVGFHREVMSVKRKFDLTVFLPIILVVSVLGWAVWHAILADIVPRHRTVFWSYESFLRKAEWSGLAKELPGTAHNLKYYWSVDRFVEVACYGVTLSEEEYQREKTESVGRYAIWAEGAEESYFYDGQEKKVEVDWLLQYNIEEMENLLWEDAIEDYQILSFYYFGGDRTYFCCEMCNDANNRMIEIFRRNKNAANNRLS
ncbi:MAG: hypothetical protein IJ833_05310 [Lachnospiraceae bacterium]|nr:hypothetical protein [Lachnospiraceae bacterium]